LRKAPGFTATVVINFALVSEPQNPIFTLVHQVMLKSLPVTKPEELWRLGQDPLLQLGWIHAGDDGDFALFSWEAYKNFREHTPEFADLAALQAAMRLWACGARRSQAPVDTRKRAVCVREFFPHTWGAAVMAG